MELVITSEDNCYIIQANGELDASSSILMDQAIEKAIESGQKRILIDCSQLNYISSAGLGVFMSYLKDFEATNTSLVLYAVNDRVKSVFQILGLDELINIAQTKEEAKLLTNESTI